MQLAADSSIYLHTLQPRVGRLPPPGGSSSSSSDTRTDNDDDNDDDDDDEVCMINFGRREFIHETAFGSGLSVPDLLAASTDTEDLYIRRGSTAALPARSLTVSI